MCQFLNPCLSNKDCKQCLKLTVEVKYTMLSNASQYLMQIVKTLTLQDGSVNQIQQNISLSLSSKTCMHDIRLYKIIL